MKRSRKFALEFIFNFVHSTIFAGHLPSVDAHGVQNAVILV